MRERKIEQRLVELVKLAGGTAYKFTSPGRAGVPDRLVLLPAGKLFFVELKAPGKKPTAKQSYEHAKLRALGQTVLVVDSLDACDGVVR